MTSLLSAENLLESHTKDSILLFASKYDIVSASILSKNLGFSILEIFSL